MVDWHARWEEGRIGFHRSEVNPTLEKYLHRLADGPAEILVPLAGKTLDLRFLADKGHKPIGVELVERAVRDFFAEQKLDAEHDDTHGHSVWSGGGVDMHVVDIFKLPPSALGHVDAIWDRAALVALQPDDRERYAARMMELLRPGGTMLLVTFDYDQSKLDGPPFAVPDAVVEGLYGAAGELERLETGPVEGPGRSRDLGVSFTESIWLLKRS